MNSKLICHFYRIPELTPQIHHLISYMEDHEFFAKQEIDKLGLYGNDAFKNMWVNLAHELNSFDDGMQKTAKQWQKVSNFSYLKSMFFA